MKKSLATWDNYVEKTKLSDEILNELKEIEKKLDKL